MAGRVFFEVTVLARYLERFATLTGIQRTAVSVIAEAMEIMDRNALYLCRWDSLRSSYRAVSLAEVSPQQILDPAGLAAHMGISTPKAVFPPLRGYVAQPAKLCFHTGRLALDALMGNERRFRRLGSSIAEWKAYRGKARPARQKSMAFNDLADPGDRIVVLDAAWRSGRVSEVLQAANRRGVTVVTLVHDLIPIVRPDLMADGHAAAFCDCLAETLDYTTYYAANSEATGKDLRAFLERRGAEQAIQVVPLAQSRVAASANTVATGLLADPLDDKAYPAVRALSGTSSDVRRLSSMRYVLCVGSMEVRKNNWRLLHAWDMMRRDRPLDQVPRLVFAGRGGWMNTDFERFLASSGHLDGLVTLIEGPSDRDLDVLYRNCLFTVMPSLYEGWGLPVGESLSYGKTAVVSHAASLPEVGGDMVLYCDPNSVTSIMEACRELLVSPGLLEEMEGRIAARRLRSWQDVARDLLVGPQAGPRQCGDAIPREVK